MIKILGSHPSGAKAEISEDEYGTYYLFCYCPAGYVTHKDWYTSIDLAKQAARKYSFTVFDYQNGLYNGRWKWKANNDA